MKKTTSILLLSTILLSSCLTKIALNSLGVFEKNVEVKFITNNNKQIVFLPMHHIGTKDYYKDETKIVDSLLKNGYIIFYEVLKQGSTTNQLLLDTMFLKFRRITGIPKNAKDKMSSRIDTVNNILMGKKSKLVNKYNLRNQDVGYFNKYDSSVVKNVDGTLEEMISMYEKKYGVVLLDQVDFTTKLREPYNHKEEKSKRNYFLNETRNIIIVDAVLKSNANKIALVYGAAHFDGILKNLQAEDKNYREVIKF